MHAAASARTGRAVTQQVNTPSLVARVVPDLGKVVLEEIAHFQVLVVSRRKWGDAAGEAIAVGGDVGRRPRAQAGGPRARIAFARGFQAVARIGRARGAQGDPQFAPDGLGVGD